MRSRQTKLEKEYATRSSTKDAEAVSRMMNVMNWENIQTHPPTVYIFSYGINHLGKPVFPQLFLNKLAAEAEHIYKKNGLNIKVVAISRPTHASYLENDMYGGTDAWVPISEGSPPAGNSEIEQKVYRKGGVSSSIYETLTRKPNSNDDITFSDARVNEPYRSGYGIAHEGLHQLLMKAWGYLFSENMTGVAAEHVDNQKKYGVNLNMNGIKTLNSGKLPKSSSALLREAERIPPARLALLKLYFKVYRKGVEFEAKTSLKSKLNKMRDNAIAEY